jgi:diguanylate cyclase (GGDEF)-like protein
MNIHPARAERVEAESNGRRALVRLLPLLAPVVGAGGAVLVASLLSLGVEQPTVAEVVGVAALLVAALVAEAYPVPVETLPDGFVSLAAVFFVGAAVLFGPAEAVLIAVAVRASLDLINRRPRVRMLYNSGAYALSAGAAGAAAWAFERGSVGHLVLEVLAAAAAYYVVNVVLIAAAIARWSREPFFEMVATSTFSTALPFAIMTSGTLMLAVLWDRSPPLTLALVGPLLAVALYQRSVHKALVATRLALTDALTGLGNQRHFQDRLQQELDRAEATRRPLALCLLDVDALKRVNDTHGHLVGDRLLIEVAGSLRQGGEAFRVGGDEFAVLLPDRTEASAMETAESLLERVTALEVYGERLRISIGVAVFPTNVSQRNDFYRATDTALYASKRAGGNRVTVHGPESPEEMRSTSSDS